ncbi:invasion protein [Aquitalea palustris]|uniref:Invasion protein n=1 Tax=Aquitalea palustris TaxID=2480983 RepID=A0A454JFG1_9NEIS|nr:SirB2 family protein [Aquitalea palustris]RMC94375.1 invasion protein [Aquitalea palustris]
MYPYLIIKHAHMGLAYLTILLFAVRGGLMLAEQQRILALKPLRILPHVIDTLLLALGVTLVVMGGWPVLQSPWLLAKIGGLLLYVLLGTIALKRGRTKQIRSIALLAALLVVGYIVLVAKTKLALPF